MIKNIRPIWLIAAGGVLAMMAICILIYGIAAGVLLWVSSGPSDDNNDTQSTEVVEAPPTAISSPVPENTQPLVTATLPNSNVPTSLPIPGSTDALPTSLPEVSPDSGAADAVRRYYELVSQNRYEATWPMLSDDFKQKFNCCAPNYDYSGYLEWWNSVDRVEFGDVRAVSQSGSRVVVYAELYYVMNTGDRSSMDNTPYIEMVYDDALRQWFFDDKRATH